MSDHEQIWLEPEPGSPDFGRTWCQDDVYTGEPDYEGDLPTRYVRADLCCGSKKPEHGASQSADWYDAPEPGVILRWTAGQDGKLVGIPMTEEDIVARLNELEARASNA